MKMLKNHLEKKLPDLKIIHLLLMSFMMLFAPQVFAIKEAAESTLGKSSLVKEESHERGGVDDGAAKPDAMGGAGSGVEGLSSSAGTVDVHVGGAVAEGASGSADSSAVRSLVGLGSVDESVLSPQVATLYRELPEELRRLYMTLARFNPTEDAGSAESCSAAPSFVFEAGQIVTSILSGMESGRFLPGAGVSFLKACVINDRFWMSLRVLCYFHLKNKSEATVSGLVVPEALIKLAAEMI